jgi:hypothetical protein
LGGLVTLLFGLFCKYGWDARWIPAFLFALVPFFLVRRDPLN